MDISFEDIKFEQTCNDQRALTKQFGDRMAKVIRRRLDDLDAALSLEDFRSLPGRCHELVGNRAGQLSLDLVHPQRLIFTAQNKAAALKDDGGLDWSKVTAVLISGVEDTHE